MSDLNAASDEEFLKAFNESFVNAEDAPKDLENTEEDTNEETDDETQDSTDDGSNESENTASDGSDEGNSPETSEEKESEVNPETEEEQEEKEEQQDNQEKEKEDSLDYKAQYEKLLAPFKANGKEIAVKNVDEAITLMQMGANYSKKMQGLKPRLKQLRLLEEQGLLEDDKLNFLIDLHKRKPEAINKLVADAEIDPMDFDSEKAKEYRPQSYAVNESSITFQDTLEGLKGTSNFSKIVDLFSAWDTTSQKVFTNQPELLHVINGHMDSGVYDMISEEVERQRIFGKLQGLSDLDAYKQVGDEINARRGFDHLFNGNKPNVQRKTVTPVNKASKNDTLNEKKRAASVSKSTEKSNKLYSDFDPLNLSDEEFVKFMKQA